MRSSLIAARPIQPHRSMRVASRSSSRSRKAASARSSARGRRSETSERCLGGGRQRRRETAQQRVAVTPRASSRPGPALGHRRNPRRSSCPAPARVASSVAADRRLAERGERLLEQRARLEPVTELPSGGGDLDDQRRALLGLVVADERQRLPRVPPARLDGRHPQRTRPPPRSAAPAAARTRRLRAAGAGPPVGGSPHARGAAYADARAAATSSVIAASSPPPPSVPRDGRGLPAARRSPRAQPTPARAHRVASPQAFPRRRCVGRSDAETGSGAEPRWSGPGRRRARVERGQRGGDGSIGDRGDELRLELIASDRGRVEHLSRSGWQPSELVPIAATTRTGVNGSPDADSAAGGWSGAGSARSAAARSSCR